MHNMSKSYMYSCTKNKGEALDWTIYCLSSIMWHISIDFYYFVSNMTSSVQGERAIPLCLPGNYQWDPETMKCTKTGEERSYMYVVEEALKKLRRIKGKILRVNLWIQWLDLVSIVVSYHRTVTRLRDGNCYVIISFSSA